jgi:hydroxysqualene synthase
MTPRHHQENFPVASWLLPKAWRKEVLAFYYYVRELDDIADHPHLSKEEKQARLLESRQLGKQEVRKSGSQEKHSSLTDDRRLTTDDYASQLWQAFWQDTEKQRYETMEEVIAYCRLSAAPVGRAVLTIAGETKANLEASDAICIALQLINHLQDIKSDYLERDRIYLPQVWLKRAGVTEAALGATHSTPSLRQEVYEPWLDRVDDLLHQGEALLPTLQSWRLKAEIFLIHRWAKSLAKRLRYEDPLAKEIKLTRWERMVSVMEPRRAA